MDIREIRKTIFFMSGMGFLGFLLALLLFGGNLFGSDRPVKDVSISSFPVSTAAVNEFQEEINNNLGIGAAAPDFTLVDLDGDSHTLSDFSGRPVILNFWATWCAPCRIEMPELEDAFNRYADEGLVILAANREEDLETVRAYFVDELGLTFTPLLDSDARVADAFGVFNMPTTFFINGSGEIKVIHRGPMTAEVIDDYMAETLQ